MARWSFPNVIQCTTQFIFAPLGIKSINKIPFPNDSYHDLLCRNYRFHFGLQRCVSIPLFVACSHESCETHESQCVPAIQLLPDSMDWKMIKLSPFFLFYDHQKTDLETTENTIFDNLLSLKQRRIKPTLKLIEISLITLKLWIVVSWSSFRFSYQSLSITNLFLDDLHAISFVILCAFVWHLPPFNCPPYFSTNSFAFTMSFGSVHSYPMSM